MNLFIKALVWRLMGTSVSFIAAFVLTGSVTLAAGVGAAEFFGKLLLYYAYEHLWLRFGNKMVTQARVSLE